MYRYITSSSTRLPKFGRFFYHGTHSEESAKSIVSNGFNSDVVYLTDSLQYAQDYGEYVVRSQSVNIRKMNLVPMVNNSVDPKDYDEGVQGVYEPLHVDPGKYSVAVFDVNTLNRVGKFRYINELNRNNQFSYIIKTFKDEDRYRRNDATLIYVADFNPSQYSIIPVVEKDITKSNKDRDVIVGEVHDLQDMYKLVEDVFMDRYGHKPYGYSFYIYSYNPNRYLRWTLRDKREKRLWP